MPNGYNVCFAGLNHNVYVDTLPARARMLSFTGWKTAVGALKRK